MPADRLAPRCVEDDGVGVVGEGAVVLFRLSFTYIPSLRFFLFLGHRAVPFHRTRSDEPSKWFTLSRVELESYSSNFGATDFHSEHFSLTSVIRKLTTLPLASNVSFYIRFIAICTLGRESKLEWTAHLVEIVDKEKRRLFG